MLDCLPGRIEPVGLADAGRSFRGTVQISDLSRLAPLLASKNGSLDVRLEFGIDQRRIRTLKGRIAGSVELCCQRCLEPLHFPLDLKVCLGIVGSEAEIDRLPDGYEPLLVTGEPLATADIIEDEILLAVPGIPLHAGNQACETGYRNEPLPKADNPFSVLEKLKD